MKKLIIAIICLIIISILVYITIYAINKMRYDNRQQPILCFDKRIANDGGTIEYHYLTYTIIIYKNNINDDEVYMIGDRNLQYKNPFYDKSSEYYLPQAGY